MAAHQIGDSLIVTGGYGNKEPRKGTIVNIRRRYMGVKIDNYHKVIDFDIEDGLERVGPNENGNYRQKARTAAQVIHDDAVTEAVEVLKTHGLIFRSYRQSITDAQLFQIALLLESP